MLTQKQNKSLVTPDWLNNYDVGKKFTKVGKKEKEEFALMAVKAGIAADLIKEMKDSPRRKMEDELNSMALANDDEVAAKLKAMKPAQFQALCEFNNIPIARNAKNAVDKTKTRPYILQKLSELREYAKLTRS